MGVDLGKKTIGLAVCDAQQSLATPLETIARKKFADDLKRLLQLVDEYNVEGLVFGYPLHMNGEKSAGCDRVESFVDELLRTSDRNFWVGFQDERLSTVSVEESVDEFVDKRKAKDSGLTDKLAAQSILQSALDYLARQS